MRRSYLSSWGQPGMSEKNGGVDWLEIMVVNKKVFPKMCLKLLIKPRMSRLNRDAPPPPPRSHPAPPPNHGMQGIWDVEYFHGAPPCHKPHGQPVCAPHPLLCRETPDFDPLCDIPSG